MHMEKTPIYTIIHKAVNTSQLNTSVVRNLIHGFEMWGKKKNIFWPRAYKTLFMLNSTEHEISTAHKTKMLKIKDVSCFQTLRCCIYHANKC